MSAISSKLFARGSTVKVRGVTLSTRDSLQAYREKLARILLDEMYQFVGLLDATGITLEINRAALEDAGISIIDIEDVMKPWDDCDRRLDTLIRNGNHNESPNEQ